MDLWRKLQRGKIHFRDLILMTILTNKTLLLTHFLKILVVKEIFQTNKLMAAFIQSKIRIFKVKIIFIFKSNKVMLLIKEIQNIFSQLRRVKA